MKKSFNNIILDLLLNRLVSIGLTLVLTFVFIGALFMLGAMPYLYKPVFLPLQGYFGINAEFFIPLYVWVAMVFVYFSGYLALIVFAGPFDVKIARVKNPDVSTERQWKILLLGIWSEDKKWFFMFLKFYLPNLFVYSLLVLVYQLFGLGNLFQIEPNDNIRDSVVFVIITGIYMILSGVIVRSYVEDKADNSESWADKFIVRLKKRVITRPSI
ncbi:MAG: hypothetical protein HY973_01050 [Candidatus Kerfeldbacteria bacterium]|nr:hypothetical protein [Candidatus Kerfeldbacteria bacterium]